MINKVTSVLSDQSVKYAGKEQCEHQRVIQRSSDLPVVASFCGNYVELKYGVTVKVSAIASQ